MRSNGLIVALAVLAGGLGLVAGGAFDRAVAPDGSPIARIGDLAPEIALPDTQGSLRRLSQHRGRPVLVNFWASWCGPCIEEMPLLDDFAADQAANGTQVLGVALDELEPVRDFLQQTPVRYPNLIEAAGRTDSSVKLGNRLAVLPFSALIAADGRVLRLKTGAFRDAEELRAWGTPTSD